MPSGYDSFIDGRGEVSIEKLCNWSRIILFTSDNYAEILNTMKMINFALISI